MKRSRTPEIERGLSPGIPLYAGEAKLRYLYVHHTDRDKCSDKYIVRDNINAIYVDVILTFITDIIVDPYANVLRNQIFLDLISQYGLDYFKQSLNINILDGQREIQIPNMDEFIYAFWSNPEVLAIFNNYFTNYTTDNLKSIVDNIIRLDHVKVIELSDTDIWI